MRYRLGDFRVQQDDDTPYVAPTATLIGNVSLGSHSSVWFNVVARGDTELIRIGPRSNVQDGCVLHADPGLPLHIGVGCTIGHMVMLHGCTIGDHTLVGIGAIVLNGAKIGSRCIIGAGALIPEGKEIPDHSVVLGAPGKVVRQTTEADVQRQDYGAEHYVFNGQRLRRELVVDDGR